MKKRIFFLGIMLFVFIINIQQTFGCTTFCLKDGNNIVFGKSMDHTIGFGYLMVNKRNVKKTAFLLSDGTPATWISKYGSITINQYGRENPNEGMNEAGLVVDEMTLEESQYPAPDERPMVEVLSWIQYQLDNSASIQDVIESNNRIRISNKAIATVARIHFLITDSTGNTLAVEFLDGKAKFYYGESLPKKCLANETYESEMEIFKKYKYLYKKYKYNSPSRFATAAYMLDNYKADKNNSIIDYSFSILDSVKAPNTVYQAVYDIKNRKIYFRSRLSPQIKSIDLQYFDFDCSSQVMMIDFNTSYYGNINGKFIPYDSKLNEELIAKAFHESGFILPKEILLKAARFPESYKCNH
ncbi:MAG: linear amide C-N hydrolase [Bacteroidota bacterium]|jgi:choloylglycine hydrolase